MVSIVLARRGYAVEAQQVLEAFDARRADFPGERLAGHRAMVAAGHLAVGNREGFDAAAAEVFSCVPAGVWPGYLHPEGTAFAEALMDRGRRDEARVLFGVLGSFGLDTLLARGELEWFDAIGSSAMTDPGTRDRYRLARASAESRERLAGVYASIAEEDFGAMPLPDAERRILYLGASLRDARDKVHASSLTPNLRRALHACRKAHPAIVSRPALWVAVAALAKLGQPITPELSWASSPDSLVRAADLVLLQAPGTPDCEVLGERLRALPPARSSGDAPWGVDAVACLARLGDVFAPDALRDLAALAGRGGSLLGALAGVALGQGDRALGWEFLGRAGARELSFAAETARSALAARGLFRAYKTLSDAIPPATLSKARYEIGILASVAGIASP